MVGAAMAAVWGAAEATLFFVVPDVIVGWIALRRPRRLVAAWLAATAGGVIGAAATHAAVRRGWDPDPIFSKLPGMQVADIERVRDAVSRDPMRAFALGAITGVPLKVYLTEAARQGLSLRYTLVLVIINRAPRIGVTSVALAAAGSASRRFDHVGRGTTGALYVLGWATFYAWYWLIRKDPGAAGRRPSLNDLTEPPRPTRCRRRPRGQRWRGRCGRSRPARCCRG
ncbi:MAG: hypothetical protein ACC726_03135 [Chloroflexota bacterium]